MNANHRRKPPFCRRLPLEHAGPKFSVRSLQAVLLIFDFQFFNTFLLWKMCHIWKIGEGISRSNVISRSGKSTVSGNPAFKK